MEKEYDHDDMMKRKLSFELGKIDTLLNCILVLGEWAELKKTYGIKDEDYPAIVRDVNAASALLDPTSVAHYQLFKNPLTELAVISQPMSTKEEKNETDSETEPQKFPG